MFVSFLVCFFVSSITRKEPEAKKVRIAIFQPVFGMIYLIYIYAVHYE